MDGTLGQVAYEAYMSADPAGVSSVSGLPLPSWAAQDPGIQARWEEAATAVKIRVLNSQPLQ